MVLVVMMAFGAAFDAAVRQPELELRGSWRRRQAAASFKGRGRRRSIRKRQNVAQGTWTLIEAEPGAAARNMGGGKTARRLARNVVRPCASGRVGSPPMTETWQADIKDASLKTLVDMLQRTAQAQVDGTWRRGRVTEPGRSWDRQGRQPQSEGRKSLVSTRQTQRRFPSGESRD